MGVDAQHAVSHWARAQTSKAVVIAVGCRPGRRFATRDVDTAEAGDEALSMLVTGLSRMACAATGAMVAGGEPINSTSPRSAPWPPATSTSQIVGPGRGVRRARFARAVQGRLNEALRSDPRSDRRCQLLLGWRTVSSPCHRCVQSMRHPGRYYVGDPLAAPSKRN